MNSEKYFSLNFIAAGFAVLALAAFAPSTRANVYATNIKIDGALTGTTNVSQGTGVTITYILNEPASSGVTIKILSGATSVRTINVAGGSAGTARGLNTVTWNGKNDGNANVPSGTYNVSITAASAGYSVWTQINTNTDAGYSVYWPSGIAVDTKTNSPYYGRIAIANGADTLANNPGVVKCNADGSYADEGPAGPSTAGYSFFPDGNLGDSCRSLKWGTDDRIYFDDWTGPGNIVACDMAMTTNIIVLNALNFPGTASAGNWSDIDITDPGTTNALGWMADFSYPSIGIWCWPLTNNGIADPNFPGINVITSPSDAIPLRSNFGLKIDEGGDIFFGSFRSGPGDTSPKITSVTNWTSASLPISSSNIGWQQGTYVDNSYLDVSDVSFDSRTHPKYVSASFNGSSAGMKILNAADGTLVTNINQNVSAYYIATCWDNVGNVYAGSGNSTWLVFSPPGANQATTVAVAAAVVVGSLQITSIVNSGATVTIQFTGNPSQPASAFTLLSSSAVGGTYTPAAGAAITGGAGNYQATVPANGNSQFYRIKQ